MKKIRNRYLVGVYVTRDTRTFLKTEASRRGLKLSEFVEHLTYMIEKMHAVNPDGCAEIAIGKDLLTSISEEDKKEVEKRYNIIKTEEKKIRRQKEGRNKHAKEEKELLKTYRKICVEQKKKDIIKRKELRKIKREKLAQEKLARKIKRDKKVKK